MTSQLSEAKKRERVFTNRGCRNQLHSMGEAKNLLQYMFNLVADVRCSIWHQFVFFSFIRRLITFIRRYLCRIQYFGFL
ncbi:hypothetical protein Ahy_B09g096856 isoform F [Arachis hypogaea]|uniref:Uncharacterized protein n=1 Tax=Arachis hypogaea TaxID=3818 RepID=A0A444XML1_ARAHY|nr:hypothetical protein Ahy_B09g096856 isoform F [Arachis hypogaea]